MREEGTEGSAGLAGRHCSCTAEAASCHSHGHGHAHSHGHGHAHSHGHGHAHSHGHGDGHGRCAKSLQHQLGTASQTLPVEQDRGCAAQSGTCRAGTDSPAGWLSGTAAWPKAVLAHHAENGRLNGRLQSFRGVPPYAGRAPNGAEPQSLPIPLLHQAAPAENAEADGG